MTEKATVENVTFSVFNLDHIRNRVRIFSHWITLFGTNTNMTNRVFVGETPYFTSFAILLYELYFKCRFCFRQYNKLFYWLRCRFLAEHSLTFRWNIRGCFKKKRDFGISEVRISAFVLPIFQVKYVPYN